jgi:hypothetical protein
VAKASKNGFFKVSSGRIDHLRELKISIKGEADGSPTLCTEIAAPKKVISGFNQPIGADDAEAMIIQSEVFPHEHFLCV